MAFSVTLKRTFEELIDVSCTTTEQPDPTSFRVPAKRQKLQVTPRKLGLEYREMISVEGNSNCHDDDLLCAAAAAARPRGENPDIPRLRLVTSSPGLMTSSPTPPRSYREVFAKDELMVNPNVTHTSIEKQFNARTQACADLTRLALLGQPVVGSACLNLSIPEYQTLMSTSPLRANEVPDVTDDRSGGFDRRTILPQLFQHPSLLRNFSFLKPASSFCLWQAEDLATNTRNGYPLLAGSFMRGRVGGHGPLNVRSRVSDRVGSEAELVSGGDEETTTGPVEVCAECHKVFKRKVYLQRHMEREHWLPAKVFKCADCKYETKHQSNLSVHRRTHTGERPYHCGACGQRYTQGHLLKSHIRSRHAGNLRFYNLDKRSDSTRGRKSLDFKHDIYLSLPNNNKDQIPHLGSLFSGGGGPEASIQAFTYQRQRLSSYMSRLPNPPLVSWDLPGRTKLRKDWVNGGGGYFAVVPQSSANDLQVSTVSGLPFFGRRSVNLSTDLPVFQTDLTQLLSTDTKPSYLTDEYKERLSSLVRLSGSFSGGDGQTCFGNEVKDNEFDPFYERTTPTQSVPEDLTVTRRRDIYEKDEAPTTISPCVDGNVSTDNAVDVDADGRGFYHHQDIPTSEHIDEINSQTNRTDSYEELAESDETSVVQSFDWEGNRDERVEGVMLDQPEVALRDDDEVPTDLSIARPSIFADIKNTTDISDVQRNAASLTDPDFDDNSNSVSSASSSDTPLLLEDRLRRRHTPRGKREEGEAAFEGAICPHFQKLQEFRRIVLRFVNAFAPNSLGIIGDKDEGFAETDLIDEIVHAAMFNDVE